MKRKFGLGQLVNTWGAAGDDQNWNQRALPHDSSSTHFARVPHLDLRTETELRQACAFVLKDLKPSGHDLEDLRMKTDILTDEDRTFEDHHKYPMPDSYLFDTSSVARKERPLSKRESGRAGNRRTRYGDFLDSPHDSSGGERQDGRKSRSANRKLQDPNHSGRRMPAAAIEEEVSTVPGDVRQKDSTVQSRRTRKEHNVRDGQPTDSSEDSSLAQSTASTNQVRSTSTGLTSAAITPVFASQRLSDNELGSTATPNPLGLNSTIPKKRASMPQTPERLKTPPIAGSRAMGSNLEAQAVAIISRRTTNVGSMDPLNAEGHWKNKSVHDLRSASPRAETSSRSETPESFPVQSRQTYGGSLFSPVVHADAFPSSVNEAEASSETARHFIVPSSDSDEASSITDEDEAPSQEDKENYISDSKSGTSQAPASTTEPSTAAWSSKTEAEPSRSEIVQDYVPFETDIPTVTSPQPIVHPKNPLRYTEPEAAVIMKEQKISPDLRDKSEEPLATARARIDAKARSRHNSVHIDSQPSERPESMWQLDAKPEPLKLKPKISGGLLGSPLIHPATSDEIPVVPQYTYLNSDRFAPTHVPNPLPPLKHEHDDSITVKDFWKPSPVAESVRSFSRPGTGGAVQRRQPAQEVIEGLLQPLRPFSPSNVVIRSELSFAPTDNSRSWSSEYIPNRTYNQQATAGPSGTSSSSRLPPALEVEELRHPPRFSVHTAPSNARATSMTTSTRGGAFDSNSQVDVSMPVSQGRSSQSSHANEPRPNSSVTAKREPRGFKKLLFRLGGGELPDRSKVVQQQLPTSQPELDEFYDDDQACEAPVIRFGRGW